MKLIKTREEGLAENYLELHYDKLDDEARTVIARIDSSLARVEGRCDDARVSVPVSDVLYFESVDRKTFAYTSEMSIEMNRSLAAALDKFSQAGLIRISKSAVVNVYQIDRLQGDLNMRVIIFLKNGEKLIMNRGYRNEFFARLEELKGGNRK